mmetsp:Transcript_19776/g.29361  ORF Transcript_19776/g.29361 Transcript_19776/m.29361 type:complete len:86 (-) Transcript_19776:159-416(-)
MYYQCLACFPAGYNYLFNNTRKKAGLLLKIIIGLLILNAAIITAAWCIWKDGEGYGRYNDDGTARDPSYYTNGVAQNVGVLSFYL